MRKLQKISASFRDPDGFLFYYKNRIYRCISLSYKEDYDYLLKSGLYKKLVAKKLLISHNEVKLKNIKCYKIIEPEIIEFISYPYEWCFSQYKDAALLTLEIQKQALQSGMILKDASAYNVQFKDGKPVWIDTLSFEIYKEAKPWLAYRQFCQHFLAPLVLMAYKDIRASQFLKMFLDGLPLDLTAKLLPSYIKLKLPVLLHIYLHSKSEKFFTETKTPSFITKRKVSYSALMGIIDNLLSFIKKLKLKNKRTVWTDYYQKESKYTDIAFKHKKELVLKYLKKINPRLVWDLGANTGVFSKLAADAGCKVLSFDADPYTVEKNYIETCKKGDSRILPLVMDFTNPSPAIGWENEERLSFIERGPAELVMALALIHHLAITNNLPFEKIAHFLARIANWLIIEFVPKDDSQVKRLLALREDIFTHYSKDMFEKEFNKYFKIKESDKIKDTERVLYLMEKR